MLRSCGKILIRISRQHERVGVLQSSVVPSQYLGSFPLMNGVTRERGKRSLTSPRLIQRGYRLMTRLHRCDECMDKIDKFFRRLSAQEAVRVLAVLSRVKTGDFRGLDIKKLRGAHELFRVRVGDVRMIFHKDTASSCRLIFIGRRGDDTYK